MAGPSIERALGATDDRLGAKRHRESKVPPTTTPKNSGGATPMIVKA
jgi:hypothetical protein